MRANQNCEHIRYRASDGARLNVYSIGRRENPTLLLCNAIGMPVECVNSLMAKLATDYFVITWESRGFPSVTPDREDLDVGLDRHVADAKEVLDLFDRQNFLIAGWCAGARLAMRITRIEKERVQAVVLMNGGYDIGVTRTPFEQTMWRNMPLIAMNKRFAVLAYESMGALQNMNDAVNDASATRQNLVSILSTSDSPQFQRLASMAYSSVDNLYQYARLVDGLVVEPIMGDEFDMAMPVLVITGAADKTTNPDASKVVSKLISGSRFVSVNGADHFGLGSCIEFQEEVKSFFDSVIKSNAKEVICSKSD